ncbi:MAG: hypothetical protein M1814_004109 [Vezdaea aestivalis]|nr:MAG: hypothetical protein M1814_004109 [Vezdaea aestivalis]
MGHIKIITFNRPENKNALSKNLISTLSREIEKIHEEKLGGPTRAVIFASAIDKIFCAGADLKERLSLDVQGGEEARIYIRDTFLSLERMPVPTIAAISGVALGGGLEMAMACRLRVVSTRSILGLPETRLGIIPGAGGLHRLPELIGRSRAQDMIYTGRWIRGEQAFQWGLADRLVEVSKAEKEREMVLEKAIELAKDIANGAPLAIKAACSVFGGRNPKERRKDKVGEKVVLRSSNAYARVLYTADRVEALKAFSEKRPPEFKGE